jgi:phosphoglycolate phosphatase
MIKAVIFDFDGTLTPLTLNFDFLRKEIVSLVKAYATDETIEALNNTYIIEMIYEIEHKIGKHGSSFRKKAFATLTRLELEASKGKDVYPYTRDVLKRLKDEHIKTGIITRTSISVVRSVFPDMKQYIDGVVAREDIKRVKPHPAHLAKVLKILSVTPQEAILVGDHPTDILTGKALKMDTVGVLTGRTNKEDFAKVEATYIGNDIRDILSILLIQ